MTLPKFRAQRGQITNFDADKAQSVCGGALQGHVVAPGDKSISHRAMIFGAMARGTTTVSGLLEGADIMSTAGAMRAFGADIVRAKDGVWSIKGRGDAGFKSPQNPVDCGNAGTGVRLIMGAAAGYPVTARYVGDASLSSRPMGRVTKPLSQMGAKISSDNSNDRLPLTVIGTSNLTPISYAPPIASAQVKSAILLAALNAKGTSSITEAHMTRDHTENMLRAFGAKLEQIPNGDGQIVRLSGPQALSGCHVTVPGDPSSAAFLIVAALISPGSDIVIENVMMNPSRTGLFETLVEMGGHIIAGNFRISGGEVLADLHIKYSALYGVDVPPRRAASMIDEYPVLAVAAAFAHGPTVMDGIGELRVKESDRISATANLLSVIGADVTELKDGLTVTGTGGKTLPGGAVVTTHHDHRIAMSALIAGLRCKAPVAIDDASMIATSFPNFFDLFTGLGAAMTQPTS
ncbi:3-phosphoshikimate 1-carboxyvinyltransferase [Robiginitomaculum antarcticum]|uniref:3-phosphoshikimate 1-carboxyvinyltransferase n=1 Tax=Robiginitomaculum antarcticum TaxID=437507 RepID=UPI0012EAB09F|nr:3-phosphoshikimate 1-carboxyvinyltransferase [Robiginitomaculum antarcticum]